MLRLRQDIRGNKSRIATRGHDQQLCGAGEQVNRAVVAHQTFGCSYKPIPRPTDFLDARNGARAIGQCGDGLRAADARQLADAEQMRGREHGGVRPRTRHDDSAHPGHLRGDHAHQHRRDQCESPAGNVAAHRVQRADDLSHAHTRLDLDIPGRGPLAFGNAADVVRRMLDGAHQRGCHRAPRGAKLAAPGPDFASRCPVSAIQPPRPPEQRGISAPAHVGDNARSDPFGSAVILPARR